MSVTIDHGVLRIKHSHQHWNIIYHVDLCPVFNAYSHIVVQLSLMYIVLMSVIIAVVSH